MFTWVRHFTKTYSAFYVWREDALITYITCPTALTEVLLHVVAPSEHLAPFQTLAAAAVVAATAGLVTHVAIPRSTEAVLRQYGQNHHEDDD
jgi:hypothetical protein